MTTRQVSFSRHIVFGNNLYAFWQNQHKLPYRCSGDLRPPLHFGFRQEILLPISPMSAFEELRRIGMPADRKGYEYKTFIKYYKRVWGQDAFTPFFIVHHFATIVIYSSHYWVNGEFQRKTEKFREIQRNTETGFQKLIACRDSLCNFASTNQNNLKLTWVRRIYFIIK